MFFMKNRLRQYFGHAYYMHLLILLFCLKKQIRMLKVVPYWKALEESLNLMTSSLLGKLNNLFVILICSCSTFFIKHAIHLIGTVRINFT